MNLEQLNEWSERMYQYKFNRPNDITHIAPKLRSIIRYEALRAGVDFQELLEEISKPVYRAPIRRAENDY